MTDDPTTLEELASAYLDGEATAAEMARVEADPALVARVAELERIRGHLATDDPPSELAERHVDTALAAFEAPDQGSGSPVTSLGDRRRRRRLYERIPLGAVAAAVMVLALVGALTQIDLAGDDDSADTAADAPADDSDDDATATAGGGDGGAAMEDLAGEEGAPAPEAESYTGGADDSARTGTIRRAFSDTDALAEHARDLLAERNQSSTTADQAQPDAGSEASPEDPCGVASRVDADRETVVLVLPAVVAGREVTALVTEADGRRLRVVDDTSCEIIDDRQL